MMMDDSSSETTTTPAAFDWTNQTPAAKLSIKVKVPRPEYYYINRLTLKLVKDLWPCSETGYKKEDQANLLLSLQRFSKQPHIEGGDYVTVTEVYNPPKSGFPGRLNSNGCQGLVRAVRSNVLKDTSDLDMNNGMPRCMVWACREFGIPAPQLKYYINNRDGETGMLRRIMDTASVSKGKAKQLVIIALTDSNKLRTGSQPLKKLDAEAKEIQGGLMAVPELQWILTFCKEDNRAGSFMSHLYHFIECKLLMRVYRMLVEEFAVDVAALVFDGLNIADKSKHGNQEILDRARSVCEEIAPGIDMIWAWKDLDFVLESKERQPLTNGDGSAKELRVPENYQIPPPKQAEGDASLLDLETQPTYDELRNEFSLGLSGKDGSEYKKHGQVGSEYICVDKEGKAQLFDTAHFKAKYRHMVYFYEGKIDGKTVMQSSPFIGRWMNDERMAPRYIKEKTERYYWEEFDMYPKSSDCPSNVYNLWSGFAAEDMSRDYNADVRAGLLLILEHLKMLCDGNAAQYNFILNILAQAVQYPNIKLGIVLCLVGKQGCGKGFVWEIIERIMGLSACFTTPKPEKDVWGDNNGRMKDAFFVRITEADKKKFAGYVGEMRTIITDKTIRVRSLYCTAANVKNYTRYFFDTNFIDAIPDEHGERRFFIIKCVESMIGNAEYFDKLASTIADDRVIRSLFDFLKARKIKQMYLGKDIPVGAYQKDLKDSRRSLAEQFLEWFVGDQPIEISGSPAPTTITLKVDELVEMYKKWQGEGEFEGSKASITRALQLTHISGVQQIKPWEDIIVGDEAVEDSDQGPNFQKTVKKQVRKYVFDLEKLRDRYNICLVEDSPSAQPQPESVDCERDVSAWEQLVEDAEINMAVENAEEDNWDEAVRGLGIAEDAEFEGAVATQPAGSKRARNWA